VAAVFDRKLPLAETRIEASTDAPAHGGRLPGFDISAAASFGWLLAFLPASAAAVSVLTNPRPVADH
jgi:hypothetical protein